MSPDTFDSTVFTSASECAQALKEQGIPLGHRLAARVHGLGRRGVRFSLALLDEAARPGPCQDLLMDAAWSGTEPLMADRVREITRGRPVILVADQEVCHLLTPDEEAPADSLVRTSGSLLPTVLGGPDVRSFHGVLWDRRRMEEAALALLDAEDPSELLEALRYLFRATTACGQDPTSLLVTALRRGRPELSREAAALVREVLDRDFGRALGDLLSEDPARIRDSLHYFSGPGAQRYTPVLQAVLLPALTPLVHRSDFRSLLLPRMPQLSPLVGLDPVPLESFLDALLAELPDLELHERFAISAFLADLGPRYPKLAGYLVRRMDSTADPHLVAFFGNVLARLRLDSEQQSQVVRRLVALFREHGQDAAISRRLRATFRALGPAPLELLSEPASTANLTPEQRTWLVHLWQDYRTGEGRLPPEEAFVRFALGEVTGRNRGSLLALVRTGQLTRPDLVRALQSLADSRGPVLSYLLDEAWRMEDPDDVPLLEVLAGMGREALERAFALVREEAALESGGEAGRLVLFGRLARRMELSPGDLAAIRAWVREVLAFSFLGPEALPAAWSGLGEVGAIAGLGEELQSALVERLGQPLERFPKARVDALLAMYPQAESPVRRQVEALLRGVLRRDAPDRRVLRACLEGLEDLLRGGPLLLDAEPLVAELCRTVLHKAPSESLEHLLLATLRESAQGDGVQVPMAWSKEDRDQALRILGAVACHPDTPERLHRMVVVRLFSFLFDWLDAVEDGRNLYAHRETPLWEILRRVLAERPGEQGMTLAREAVLRLLEVHRRRPDALALARREKAQRFLLELVRLESDGEVLVKGVRVDLGLAVLRTLQDLAARAAGENRVTEYLLRELAAAGTLPDGRQEDLVAFLAGLAP